MKNMFFYSVCLLGFVLAGQVFAAGTVYLPTVAYRDGGNTKIEYAYDSYGHVTSEKHYLTGGSGLELAETILRGYHRLPNGEFVVIKDERINVNDPNGGAKMAASYDSKGMQLSYKYEYGDIISDWTEAIVNAQGIRTGWKVYNPDTGQLETSSDFTFNGRGQVTQTSWEDGEEGTYTYTYTWGNELSELISARLSIDNNEVAVFSNIVPVKNLEYFNAYTLDPLGGSDSDYNVNYVWEDYKLHSLFVDMDVLYNGQTGAYKCTIDDVKGEWTKTLTIGGEEVEKTVLEKLPNGGWSETETASADFSNIKEWVETREYNEYGALTRYYLKNDMYDEEDTYSHEYIYERTYDAQGRPTATTCNVNGQLFYVETYDAWTNISAGIHTPEVVAPLTVYPAITTGVVFIENPENEAVSVYTVSGAQLFNVRSQNIDLSGCQNGLYLVKVGNRMAKVIKK